MFSNWFGNRKVKDKLDLLLTTYPERKSRNVGDNLISHSAVKVAKTLDKNYVPSVYFRETDLGKVQGRVRSILAPGFSVANETYPKLYKLYDNVDQLKNFAPIGCSFQYPGIYYNVFDEFKYGIETLRFLEAITEKHGALHCRDDLIVQLLSKHGIPCLYSGDMALYDPKMIGVAGRKIKNIKSIVFTAQHSPFYNKQAINILRSLKENFRSAKLYVALHSRKNKNDKILVGEAEKLGYRTLELSGEVDNLKIYKNIDLHVGYRLHGHIHYLRNRKPSILIVEDVRSYGFSLTPGTALGCFSSLKETDASLNMHLGNEICAFIRKQLYENFEAYRTVGEFIDMNYKNIIEPYFKEFNRKRGIENAKL